MRRIFIISVLALFGVSFGVLAGCSKDSDKSTYVDAEGRVSAIDLETGVVKMWTYRPKKQKEIELEGKLSSDAEVLINGAVARLEDLRIEDKVKVVGRIEKRNNEKSLVATHIHVTRQEKIKIDTETKPAGG